MGSSVVAVRLQEHVEAVRTPEVRGAHEMKIKKRKQLVAKGKAKAVK